MVKSFSKIDVAGGINATGACGVHAPVSYEL